MSCGSDVIQITFILMVETVNFVRPFLQEVIGKCDQEGRRGTSGSQNREISYSYCNLGLTARYARGHDGIHITSISVVEIVGFVGPFI